MLLAIATLIELAGSIALVTGYRSRAAALIMFAYLLAVTVLSTTTEPHNPQWLALRRLTSARIRRSWAVLLLLVYGVPGRRALGRPN